MNEPTTISRRDFLAATSLSTIALLSGCATDPVTGRQMFDLMGESGELSCDREASPHQFSADYGAVQDDALNRYLTEVGNSLGTVSHRPGMPYSFRGVNAVYVNAYTFPAGSIAITRGMLLGMKSEAELAAVLGHEIGHVNARHTASAMSWGMLAELAVAGTALYLGRKSENRALIAAGLGMLGAGALLARYSRENEREADALGMAYMVKAGYTPQGMIDLMDLLKRLGHDKPNVVEMLFATHPMSDERYQTAANRARGEYAQAQGQRIDRERYLDNIVRLRARQKAIELMQKGEEAMEADRMTEAEELLQKALNEAPDDYAGQLLMARLYLSTKRAAKAAHCAQRAQEIYPAEGQACFITGVAAIEQKQYDSAYATFNRYETLLPGNPNTVFYQGRSLEGMGRRKDAADCFTRYVDSGDDEKNVEYCRQRLLEWGYIKPEVKEENPK